MKPSRINAMLNTAEKLKQDEPTAAFLTAWAAWEAYLHRTLEVALRRQGLSKSDAQTLLNGRAIWRKSDLQKTLRAVLGQSPSQMQDYSRYWHLLYSPPLGDVAIESVKSNAANPRSYAARRHQLVHGQQSVRPETLTIGVERIHEIIRLPMFGTISFKILFGDHRGTSITLADPLESRADLRRPRGSATLRELQGHYGWGSGC